MLTVDARHENVSPCPDLANILKLCLKGNDRSKFPENWEQTISYTTFHKSCGFIGQKHQNNFQ